VFFMAAQLGLPVLSPVVMERIGTRFRRTLLDAAGVVHVERDASETSNLCMVRDQRKRNEKRRSALHWGSWGRWNRWRRGRPRRPLRCAWDAWGSWTCPRWSCSCSSSGTSCPWPRADLAGLLAGEGLAGRRDGCACGREGQEGRSQRRRNHWSENSTGGHATHLTSGGMTRRGCPRPQVVTTPEKRRCVPRVVVTANQYSQDFAGRARRQPGMSRWAG